MWHLPSNDPRDGILHACLRKNRCCAFRNFRGFSADAVSGRIVDCESKIVITADAGKRGNKIVPLKAIVDEAISLVPPDELTVRSVLVVDRLGGVASGESVRNCATSHTWQR